MAVECVGFVSCVIGTGVARLTVVCVTYGVVRWLQQVLVGVDLGYNGTVCLQALVSASGASAMHCQASMVGGSFTATLAALTEQLGTRKHLVAA